MRANRAASASTDDPPSIHRPIDLALRGGVRLSECLLALGRIAQLTASGFRHRAGGKRAALARTIAGSGRCLVSVGDGPLGDPHPHTAGRQIATMDGNTFALAVFAAFNLLSLAGAAFCARRSYRRHRRPLRAASAGLGGLFIAPMVLVVCVALVRPQPVRNTYRTG